MAPSIETERFFLRPFAPGDLDALAAIYADPEVMAYLLGGPRTREQSRARLHEMIAHWGQHGFGLWAVVCKRTQCLLGECGLRRLDDSDEVELHYVFAKPHWGKGLATESAGAVLHHGFETLSLDRVIAFALPENAASFRVMRKLGMAFERNGGFRGAHVVYYALGRDAYLDRRPVRG